jgi:AcrR family transcriptional regulator
LTPASPFATVRGIDALPDLRTAPASPAARGRREATKAANRAAIVAAAREVFAELGYGAATVRDIVRRTGLASGTFYNYFPDKESVLRALVEDAAVEVRRRVRAQRARARTLEDFLAGGFRAYLEYLAADRAMFELVRRNSGTIRALFDTPAVGAGVHELAEDLAAAADAGLAPAIDAQYAARAIVGAVFEVGARMLDASPPDIDGAVTFLTELFVGGLERLAR